MQIHYSLKNKKLAYTLSAAFVLALIGSSVAWSLATTGQNTQEIEYTLSEKEGRMQACYKSSELGNTVLEWTANIIKNLGPGQMHIVTAAFHSPYAGCEAYDDSLASGLNITGKTDYPEGDSGSAVLTYDTTAQSCGRVQLDAGFRDENSNDIVFFGVVVDYGTDCAIPIPPPTVDIKARQADTTNSFSDGPVLIDYNSQAEVSWESDNTVSCEVKENWRGSFEPFSNDISGQQVSGELKADAVYQVDCVGTDGTTVSDLVSVNVSQIPPEPVKPSCSNAGPDDFVTEDNVGTHDVFAYGVQNATGVKFAVWSEENGQDDLIWYQASDMGGGTWKATIDLANHPGMGMISVHAYVFGEGTSEQLCDTADFERVPDTTPEGDITVTKTVRNVSQNQTSFSHSVNASFGETVEYKIVTAVTNGEVQEVSLEDLLPSRLHYLSDSLMIDNKPAGNDLEYINLGNVKNKEIAATFKATVADDQQFSEGTTTLTNEVKLEIEEGTLSDTADVVVMKTAPPVKGTVAITKEVRNVSQNQTSFVHSTNANPGEQVEFKLTTQVTGSVKEVKVADSLPNRLNFVNGSLIIDGKATSDSLGDIELGDLTDKKVEIKLQATVADASQFSDGITTLTNTANLSSEVGNKSDSADVVVIKNTPPQPGTVSIVKSVRNFSQNQTNFVSSISAAPGERVEFQLVVSVSDGNIQSVVVSDQLPNRLTYVSDSLKIDDVVSGNDISSISLGSLTSGQVKKITFKADIAKASQFAEGNTILTNNAQVTSSNNSDSDSASVTVNKSTPPTTTAHLDLEKQVRNNTQDQTDFVNSTNADPGDQIEFRIKVTNQGDATANDVTISDVLPDNFHLDTGSTDINVGSLNAGASQTYTLSATVGDESNFPYGTSSWVNTATASASNATTVTDTATVIVNRSSPSSNNSASLSIVKEVRNVTSGSGFSDSTSASANDIVQFRITVRDVGSATATNVRLRDSLPNGLYVQNGSIQIDYSTGYSGDLFNNGINLGSLSVNQSRTIIFDATVNNSSSQTFMNTATASADNANTVSDSASVFVSTVSGNNIDLSLSKRAYNQTKGQDATGVVANSGDIIVYTLSVRNQGTAIATNYVFEDDLSDVLQLSNLNDFPGADFNTADLTLRWQPVDIAPGSVVEKTFSVRIRDSFPAGSDSVMTNVFNNTVNVQVRKPQVSGAYIAPKTGPAASLSIILSFLVLVGFVVFKQKEWILARLAVFTNKN